MKKPRIIAALLWSDGKIIESKNFNHTNIIHDDVKIALENFNKWAVDEILLINVSRKKKYFEKFRNDLKKISNNCFVPISAGGRIEKFKDAYTLLRSGCDRVIINTLFFNNLNEVKKIIKKFGAQSIIASIDVKKIKNKFYVFIDRGKINTQILLKDYIKKFMNLEIGEILLTSINNEGSSKGYDLKMYDEVKKYKKLNYLLFGGANSYNDIYKVSKKNINGLVIANMLHYKENEVFNIKKFLLEKKIKVRNI